MQATSQEIEAMFPQLGAAQLERLRSFAPERRVQPGEILYDQGDSSHGVFVVLSGAIEIVGVTNGDEIELMVLGPGTFTGEVNQLSGRRSLVRCRVREAGAVLELGRSCLRRIMQTDATLGGRAGRNQFEN
jgi:thioredoxin reductase (NADPH)